MDKLLSNAVIELSGGWEGSTPQFIFQPPSLFSKIALGGQAKPPQSSVQ